MLKNGHSYSEVCNESVIEPLIFQSLHACPGRRHMVDNCSTTARLGARKWGPRFDHLIEQEVFTAYDQTEQVDEIRLKAFVQTPYIRPWLSVPNCDHPSNIWALC